MITRLLYFIISLVIGFVALVFVVGIAVPKIRTSEITKEFPIPSATVWAILTNVQTYGEWHPDALNIQLLGTNDAGYPKWKQYSKSGSSETFEITYMLQESDLEIKLVDSPFNIESSWNYRFNSTENGVIVMLRQKTKIEGIFLRGFLTLLGSAHSNVEEEMSHLYEMATRVEKR